MTFFKILKVELLKQEFVHYYLYYLRANERTKQASNNGPSNSQPTDSNIESIIIERKYHYRSIERFIIIIITIF